VADIARVQAHFGPADGVGEVRIRLDAGHPRRPLAGAMGRRRLPPGLSLRAAADNQARLSNVSRAYRVNLNVLAMVALLTGAFLVFATQLTAVAQRSTQFALLGVLGLSPRMRLASGAARRPGDRRAGRRAIGLALGYAMAVAFTRRHGRRPRRRLLLRQHAGDRARAAAGAGLLRPGLRGQPRPARSIPGLAQPRTAPGAGAEDRLRASSPPAAFAGTADHAGARCRRPDRRAPWC
jgi:putative ABC transport system permease protein